MFNTEDYTIICHLFPRLLGMIYFFAFGAFLFQINGLIGVDGILPANRLFTLLNNRMPGKKSRYFLYPSLFWINQSNTALMGVTIAGTVLSVILMLGFYPSLLLLLLFVLYISIVTAGQEFLGFGWEGLLLETTIQGFLISLTEVPNMMVWISTNLLLFRFHVQAGLVKILSKDQTWRNLTALSYHYQTQPLPNTQAWYFHKLPGGFQKFSCLVMFAIEIGAPFGIFFTEDIRLWTFALLFYLQFLIWFTGNFSYLNHLTAVLCAILLNNQILAPFFSAPEISPTPLYISIPLTLIGTVLASFQLMRLWLHWFPNKFFQALLGWAAIYHIANRYGIFGRMTTVRHEIVIEGSHDGKVWQEYLFKWKPSEITRRPRRIAPYQPRIDWQIWFLPFTRYHQEPWMQNFLVHLLKGTPVVLKLLRGNPFEGQPPKYVRAIKYDYVFSSFEERRKHGWWWKRVYITDYTPVYSLK